MIDLHLLREEPSLMIKRILKKDPRFPTQLLFDLDARLRSLKQTVELLRHSKNELARPASSGITPEIREKSIEISKQLKLQEQELELVENQFQTLYLTCPNVPEDDIPEGNKQENQVVKTWKEKPEFDFAVKNHVDLGEELGWFDFKTAALIAGTNFALYKADAVRLLYALSFYMLKNNTQRGYNLVLPPALVNEQSLTVASNFPKFKDQVYAVTADSLYLTPTAEVDLANMYRNHILAEQDLPIRMTAWTSCFRREAGTYGATERGLIRIHQFEKIELYTLCTPENSSQELDHMVSCAETILQALGLHYRISLLAGQDCSFASAKTYDIEVWLPGQKSYYEVSSCSNCTDFQARRGMIRYKQTQDSKARLVHTLNASSLALPRLMVAIMETYQQSDGSIAIPDVIKPWYI